MSTHAPLNFGLGETADAIRDTTARWAADRLAAMTPSGHHAVVHVTLTDDHPWAQAFVVIEARPGPGQS